MASLLTMLLGCRGDRSPTSDARALAERMQPGRFEAPGFAYPLPYRLFVPEGYDPRRRYPIIVYLHGSGGRGTDGIRHLSAEVGALVSERVQSIARSFVLAPQCPPGDEWVNRHASPPFSNYDQARVPESDAARMTLALLEVVAGRFSIDRARIYVTGFSMGGSGTWDLVTRHPGVFAAAVPVTGVSDPSRARAIAGLPVWAFHGTVDEISPIANTRAMLDALRRAGSTARLTELPGVGHGSSGPAYSDVDMYRWLFSQRRDLGASR